MPFPPTPDPSNSLELLQRLRGGEAAAFDALFRRHRDELLLAVRAGMGPRLRAAMQSEDVLQSVALEAFQALQRGTPTAAGFVGTLVRLVRHRLVDRARKLQRRARLAEVRLSETVSGAAVTTNAPSYGDPRYERLERALAALPRELRDIIRWRRFDGLSSQEIAARTGRSDDAVRKLLSRAMAKLTLLVEAGS